jgi:hypothetical protein
MSTHPIVVETNESDTIADALIQADTVAVDQLIARVLGRARGQAEDLEAPNDARAILHVAHLFADELAVADPQFDRQRFIQKALG